MSDLQITPAELAEWRGLLEAATKGPWAKPFDDGALEGPTCSPGVRMSLLGLDRDGMAIFDRVEDCALVVALVNAAPRLLAAAERVGKAQANANQRAASAESRVAALEAELGRVRGRLERAQTFEWRGADGTEWNIHSYDDPSGPNWNVCRGIKLHAHGVTLDAAWAAAEKAVEGAAKKEGE